MPARRRVRFRRNGRDVFKGYVELAMTHTLDINTRVTRRCLHAGRLLSGV